MGVRAFVPAILIAFLPMCSPLVAKRTRLSGDFNSLGAAIRMFETTTGRYPTAAEGLQALVSRPDSLPQDVPWKQFLDEIPLDPWQNPYGYVERPEDPWEFGFYSMGPDGIESDDDVLSWDESTSPSNRRQAAVAQRWWIGGLLVGLAVLAWAGPKGLTDSLHRIRGR